MQQLECPPTGLKGINIARQDGQEEEINPQMITATTIIGYKVRNTAGQEIGRVEDIVMDLTRGSVSYVVLSSGGFAGIGDKFFSVPLDALTLNIQEKILTIKIDKKDLKKSPGFDKHNWPVKAEWPIDRP